MKNFTLVKDTLIHKDLMQLMSWYVCANQEETNKVWASGDNDTENWKTIANNAVKWCWQEYQEVKPLAEGEYAPAAWAHLYYMMCAFMNEYMVGAPTLHTMKDQKELAIIAYRTLQWLKGMALMTSEALLFECDH